MADIIKFPVVEKPTVEQALDSAKGWGFKEVFIVGYVDDSGTPEGTIIQTSSHDEKTSCKNQLFMAELLRYMAMKRTGLI